MRGSSFVLTVALPLVLGAGAVLPGCGTAFPAGWAQTRAELVAARHPAPASASAEPGRALNIEVIREGGTLRLVNREPQRFDGARLWINRQYAGNLDRVPIGTGPAVSLDLFVNRHGESFPRARFLRPDRAAPLVLAELVPATAGAPLHPLVVVPEN